MKNTLSAGISYQHSYQVPSDKTVPHVFKESDLFAAMPPVFATAFMVGLMEWACMESLRPHMEEGEISLGTHICVSHQAATPVGMKVTVDVTCTKVDDGKTTWEVTARDEKDLIGKGTHERFTINAEKFAGILRKKSGEL
ncbi:MAG TPA: thioesterase family protein [Pelovirga sp.]|nr:thioesterase family protein [Pelovirga sp.]